jgi:class 3 adenylate cyclase/tetratricopeptide (TPR) repeat protein
MQCPKCHFENRDEAKFCGECGHKFEITCPECGTHNRAENKFCDECGHKLTAKPVTPTKELSFDEKLFKIQKYLPKGLTEKILSQKDRIEGEWKQVTVMFCDMEGFTKFTELIGPDDTYSIMDQIYEILIHKVHDFEGTVNEMTGDGIMALYGAPIALEDAPQRAIRSSLAIHREMAKFNDKLKQENANIPVLKMRIGIHTGPVVVGTLGNDLRVEFKAVGDTVNIASRIEGLADPGTTYITEETFKLAEGFFRVEALGERKIRGKEKFVQIYRVIATSTRRTRFDVSAERGLTPFLGRERELELLLDGLERAKQGRGQAFSITAEAGVGKSRLLYEFRKVTANEDVTFLEGKCLSFSRGVTYHPIIDLFKSNFDIREGDGDAEIMLKVKKGLKILRANEASTLPYLLELLSVKESGIDQIPMSPEHRKNRMIETMIRIPLKGSEIRPLIMVIEDLHWIDKSSEDVLKYLLESMSGSRIILMFTYRPEFVHTWGGRSYHNQVNLNRLSNRESLSMVYFILGTEDIDKDLENLILEKTEGVPFFIEEFLKSLKALKLIEKEGNRYHLTKSIQELAIPSTIQDVIMTRVDALPERPKEVLQTGSVIEREFSYELIKRVTGLSEKELLSNLSILKDSELLFERGIFPESTYIFKHALTREVVYGSILMKRKKKLHEEIGEAIEELYKNSVDEHYGVLAEHYSESENHEKAAIFLKLAAQKAGKSGSLTEAIAYTNKLISSLERLPRTDEFQKMIIDAKTILGLRMIEMNYFIEAKEAITPIIGMALESNYEKRISQIFTIIGTYELCIEENLVKALANLEKALKVSEKIQDFSSTAANYWLGYALSYNCEFEKASHFLEKTIDLFVRANIPGWVSTVKACLSYFVYYHHGSINLAYQTSHEAVRTAELTGDIYSKVVAYSCHGFSCYGKGFLEEATNYLLKGIDFSARINHFYFLPAVNEFFGEVYSEIGKYQTAIDHYKKAIRLREQSRLFPSFTKLTKIALARAMALNNERDIYMESLYEYVSENKMKQCDGWMRRYIGEILLKIDDQHISEAEEWIKKAIKADKMNGMMFHLGMDHILYAELFKRKGDQSKARETLGKSIEILKECGADGWVEKYEKELAKL